MTDPFCLNLSLFPEYRDWAPRVPVRCLTPENGGCIHRFFDTNPISPSGRYLAVFRLPFEDRLNRPGEEGEIVLVDLETGGEKVLARTKGWEAQLGANINWGADDHSLLFNDVDEKTWTPVLVNLDPLSGKKEILDGGVYHVSPDGRFAAACSLEKMVRCQHGYGVRLPDEKIARNIGAWEDDGLFVTDLQSGKRNLVFSLRDAVRFMPDMEEENPDDWEIYGFHAKWSPRGDRILFSVRRFPQAGPMRWNLISSSDPAQQMRYDVFTMKPDGTELFNAVPAKLWALGGHHVNWHPDGQSLSMNLRLKPGEGLSLVRVGYDGSNLARIVEGVPGSGHPTLHPDGKHILTDSYANEEVAFGDGTVPLRWIDLETGTEKNLLRIGAGTGLEGPKALRVDSHPAWTRDWQRVVFNGVRKGEKTRRVFVAGLAELFNRG